MTSAARDRRVAAAAVAIAAALAILSFWAVIAAGSGPVAVDPVNVLMRPNMSAAVVLVALALVVDGGHGTGRRRISIGLAAAALLIAVLTLIEYGANINIGIDELLAPDAAHVQSGLAPGRMPPGAAVGIGLLAVAAILLRVRRRRAAAAAQGLAVAAMLLGNLSFLAYAFGPTRATGIVPYVYVPIATGLAWFGLGMAILLERPAEGPASLVRGTDVAGRVTRALLVATFIGLPVLGWIRLAAERTGVIDRTFGVAFLVATSVAALVVVALWLGALIRRSEHATEAAREDRDRFFEVSADMFALVGTDGRFRTINAAWERTLGWTPAEITAVPFVQFVHPDDAAVMALAMERGLDMGPTVDLENRFRHRDGTYRWLEWNAVADAATGTFYASARDVTESRRESETLRAMFAASPFGILLLDRGSVIRYWSEGAVRLLGYPAAEVVGKEIEFLPGDERLRADSAFGRLGDGNPVVLDTVGLHRDGTQVSIRLHTTALRDRDDTISGALTFIEDRREQLQLEEALRQSQKMEAIGRLAGGVAHDFNNLLTAIGGYADLLAASLPDDEAAQGDLGGIRTAANRAAALTAQLLAFSRRSPLRETVLDPDEVLAELVPMLRRLLGEDIGLDLVPAPEPGLIRVDRGQLEQVIVNLAVNARDAMPDGGRLTIDTAVVELDSSYARTHAVVAPGRYVMIAVTDTGTGIPAEVLGHIFEPFFTTKPAGQGTGLGLSMVDGIVRQSGGSISVYAEAGRGTAFKVYLPLVEDEAPTAIAALPSPLSLEGRETILLAEDEDAVRELCEIVLRGHGYEVRSCASGEKALEEAPAIGRIDLLLTDVIMTGMTGRTLAERLTVMHPEARVLYVSGYTANAIVHHGVVDEGIQFLAKPFTPVALARMVRSVLDAPDEVA